MKELKMKKPKENKENKKFSNSSKMNKENELSSPFGTNFKLKKVNFDEKKIRESLEEILDEKDQEIIDMIIEDKQYFPDNLTNEVGVFRDIKGNILEVFYGEKEGFNIPLHIMGTGAKKGLSIMSHNHANGLVIPSPEKDIVAMIFLKSKYCPTYSPNKTGLLVNSDVLKNKINWEEISNKYNKFFEDKKVEIQKLYTNETKKIKDNYTCKLLDKKLDDDLYRPYFVKNQDQIAKKINNMFKRNNFDLRFYIL